ncbi:MAG TPA: nicotinate-nucleotide adenylyltransferase, partial [Anaerolinea sp.]|nr:nicotinate-nucleotide adenylyltransferase [Anaerolinea sp.]
GGPFDPPHVGPLILAAEPAAQLGLDKVLWVITADPPHKHGQVISPLEVRLKLLRAALDDDPRFEISRVDIDRPGPQYAVDTVQILKGLYPGSQLFYLLGGDSLRDLPKWYAPQRLLATVDAVGVMRRPGDLIDLGGLERTLPGLSKRVQFVDAPLLEIASRDIRERLAENRHFRYFLPDAVYALIVGEKLYQGV